MYVYRDHFLVGHHQILRLTRVVGIVILVHTLQNMSLLSLYVRFLSIVLPNPFWIRSVFSYTGHYKDKCTDDSICRWPATSVVCFFRADISSRPKVFRRKLYLDFNREVERHFNCTLGVFLFVCSVLAWDLC